MALPKRYIPEEVEPGLLAFWNEQGTYQFRPAMGKKVYSIDTPPPTVSGNLHLGHTFSYTHADLFARFWRMRLSGTGPKAGGPYYLHRFATERTITINTAAVGGNASLLTL